MTTILIIINLIIVALIYLGAVEMLVMLGVERREARWWYVEAFLRGAGRAMGDPPAGGGTEDDDHDDDYYFTE